jgi:hypothetical protein
MSDTPQALSDAEQEFYASYCLLSQCKGCSECQNGEALKATLLIGDLQEKIKEAQEEIEHLEELRRLLCVHHFAVHRKVETCARCGLSRESVPVCRDGKRRCIREGCVNDAEEGPCPKHGGPKLACSLACYDFWKAARTGESTGQEHVGSERHTGDGGVPEKQKAL